MTPKERRGQTRHNVRPPIPSRLEVGRAEFFPYDSDGKVDLLCLRFTIHGKKVVVALDERRARDLANRLVEKGETMWPDDDEPEPRPLPPVPTEMYR